MRYTARQLKTAGRNKKTNTLRCTDPRYFSEAGTIDPLFFSRLLTRKEQMQGNPQSMHYVASRVGD